MMALKPLMELAVQVGEAHVTPNGPCGARRFVPVIGGTFVGARLSGLILPGGADFQLIRSDGVAELDARITLQLPDGSNVQMHGLGLRHGTSDAMRRLAAGEAVQASAYYFRQSMLFEAPKGEFDWLNRLLAVGVGERRPDGIRLAIYEVM